MVHVGDLKLPHTILVYSLVATLLITPSESWKPSFILDEGDDCSLPDGSVGRCWRRSLCRSAYENRKLTTSVCGYNYNTPVVCCAEQLKSEKACDLYRSQKIPLLGVTNGLRVMNEEFPHMAALGYSEPGEKKTLWLCGGTLISDRFVLTAAHCVVNLKNNRALKVVRLGQTDVTEEKERTAEDYKILQHFEPKRYKPNMKNPRYDLSLLYLHKSVPYSPRISPACLYTEGDIPSGQMTVAGWGTIDPKGRELSQYLRKAYVTRMPQLKCPKDFEMDSTVICAANFESQMDTCVGDSGGPIQIQEEGYNGMFYLVGVTSYGKGDCGGAFPTVYTSVFSFLDWIESIVWSDTL